MHREEFGDEWPLTEDLIKILDENREALIDIIDPNHNGLIDSLLSAKVITQRQRTFISEKPDTLTKNTALLNVLRRLSVKGYKSTVNCLEKSNQKHVAEILSRGGGRLNSMVLKAGNTGPCTILKKSQFSSYSRKCITYINVSLCFILM